MKKLLAALTLAVVACSSTAPPDNGRQSSSAFGPFVPGGGGLSKPGNAYGGVVFEWNEDFLAVAGAATTLGALTVSVSGTAATSANVGATTRPGVWDGQTGTTATGIWRLTAGTNQLDFGSLTSAVFEWTGGVPILSTAVEEFSLGVGFFDVTNQINQTDGCYFLYDRGNVATSGPNTTNADKWSCWCTSNSVRTTFIMDGVAVSNESFTTVNTPIAALTLPSTNIARLKVLMTSATRAEFFVDSGSGYTKRCDINTNIPTGAARLTSAGILMLKGAGLTSRSVYLDQTRLAYTLSAVRVP